MAAVYALPTLLVVVLLASRRVALLPAGVIGLAATLLAALAALPEGAAGWPRLLQAALSGAWLAWHAIAVILAGLVFHQVTQVGRAEPAPGPEVTSADPHRRLFAACFLLGPFFEAATGFGVGLVIVVPILLRLGLAPVWAAVFGLYSQTLVPWGAMAIGSTVGAGLAGLDARTLGVGSALVEAPLLLGYLGVFWWLARQTGQPPRALQMLDDLAWTLALAIVLLAVNRWLALEAGALVSCGGLMALRALRDERALLAEPGPLLRQAAPYAALTALVLASRGLPAVREALQGFAVLQPVAGQPGFAPLYHVSVLILAVALGNALARGLTLAQWRQALAATWRSGRKPVAVTLVFVVMGQVTGASGMAAAMTEALVATAGAGAVLATPVMAGLGGFLTGSNVAANAIAMPLQVQIATQTGLPLSWLAALQNTAGSNLTLLSPIRVAMGAALIATPGAEAEIYRRALPMLIMLAGLLLAMAAGVLVLA